MCSFGCVFVLCDCFVCLCWLLRVFSVLLVMAFAECCSLGVGVVVCCVLMLLCDVVINVVVVSCRGVCFSLLC